MSKRGNDLVRRYLWMACLSAVQLQPGRACPVRPSGRQASRNRRPSPSASHAQAAAPGLCHLEEGKPFDPQHYPWDSPAMSTQWSDNPRQRGKEKSPSDNTLSLNRTRPRATSRQ